MFINLNNGTLDLGDNLVLKPNFSFDDFKKTTFYSNQDSVRMFYLDKKL